MQKISIGELKNKIENEDDFYLIDVLTPQSYEARHIPNAVNIPGGADFVTDVEEELNPDKNDEIIVYCSSETCMASVRSGEVLEKAGYENVKHFAGGLAGWQDAGYEFKSTNNNEAQI